MSKVCANCKESKEDVEFYPGKNKDGLHSWCKKCCSLKNKGSRDRNPPTQSKINTKRLKDQIRSQTIEYKRQNNTRMKSRPVEVQMLDKARQRAKKKGLAFDLKSSDIIVPEICPILRIPIQRAVGSKHHSDNSPTLDRVDSTKGYTNDNVWVISWRANRLKSDASLDELRLMVSALERKVGYGA